MNNIYAIILAAGNSTRFGATKQLHRLNGKTLLQHTLAQAQEIFADRVLVILGADSASVKTSLQDCTARIVDNPHWREGMASSIRVGVRALPPACNAVMILLGDQPRISSRSLLLLVDSWQQNPETIITSGYRDTFGVPAIFPSSCFSYLLALEGDKGAKQFLQQNTDRVLTVPMPEAGMDIDTPEDLEQLNQPEPTYGEPQ